VAEFVSVELAHVCLLWSCARCTATAERAPRPHASGRKTASSYGTQPAKLLTRRVPSSRGPNHCGDRPRGSGRMPQTQKGRPRPPLPRKARSLTWGRNSCRPDPGSSRRGPSPGYA
jgi:hypothetical protein